MLPINLFGVFPLIMMMFVLVATNTSRHIIINIRTLSAFYRHMIMFIIGDKTCESVLHLLLLQHLLIIIRGVHMMFAKVFIGLRLQVCRLTRLESIVWMFEFHSGLLLI